MAEFILQGIGRVRIMRVPLFATTDAVAMRCFKAGVPYPKDWQKYTQALRDVTKQPDTENVDWPTQPELPDGV